MVALTPITERVEVRDVVLWRLRGSDGESCSFELYERSGMHCVEVVVDGEEPRSIELHRSAVTALESALEHTHTMLMHGWREEPG